MDRFWKNALNGIEFRLQVQPSRSSCNALLVQTSGLHIATSVSVEAAGSDSLRGPAAECMRLKCVVMYGAPTSHSRGGEVRLS